MDNKEFNEQEQVTPIPEPELSEDSLPVIEELSFQPEPEVSAEAPEEAPAEVPEEVPAEEPESLDHALLEDPVVGQELQPDDHAMDFHGILNHGEEEPPFDMSRLDLPEIEEIPETIPGPEEEEALAEAPLQEDAPQEKVPAEELSAEAAVLLPELPPEASEDQAPQNTGEALQEAAEAPPAKPTPRQRPLRKGRPKRKKGEGLLGIPNILATVVWLALILAIGVTAGRMLWVCAADVLAFGRENKQVTVTIYEADDMDTIIDKLYDAGLIRYKGLFGLYASISDAEEDIKPGIYDLNTLYDYHALVSFMSPRSSREVIELTIPEGYTCRQIFALLEENRVCTAVDAAAYAATGEFDDYWFLEGLPRGTENCLEGFLFPDTYEFYKNSTPREALQRMLNNFEIKFSEEMMAQMDALNLNVTGGGYGIREIVIVASLIEKESAAPAESAKIAGVIYNRLHNWGGTPAYLNIDAAMVYALNKNDITAEDLQTDHPYNTYLHTGLTPGAISNPGLSSLQAALTPESHNYYFYVLNPSTGMHQFSTTQEEHDRWIQEFYG